MTESNAAMALSFGQAAGIYEAGRPGYPSDAVAWLLDPARHNGGVLEVADVGAGTGKLTRTLVELGADTVAIDPDLEMLSALRDNVPGVKTLPGTAERMPLPDESVDAVVLGQAWHWVDPEAGFTEVARVLRPGGVLGLVWNIRDESVPWVARLTRIMKGSNAEELLAGGGPRVGAPFGPLEEGRWEWSRPVTRDVLTAMVNSRSYVITASVEERARIDNEVGMLFDEIGAVGDGTVALPYVTHAFRAVRPT